MRPWERLWSGIETKLIRGEKIKELREQDIGRINNRYQNHQYSGTDLVLQRGTVSPELSIQGIKGVTLGKGLWLKVGGVV